MPVAAATRMADSIASRHRVGSTSTTSSSSDTHHASDAGELTRPRYSRCFCPLVASTSAHGSSGGRSIACRIHAMCDLVAAMATRGVTSHEYIRVF